MTGIQVIFPCCRHCDHDVPWGGRDTLTDTGDGHTIPCQCQQNRIQL